MRDIRLSFLVYGTLEKKKQVMSLSLSLDSVGLVLAETLWIKYHGRKGDRFSMKVMI